MAPMSKYLASRLKSTSFGKADILIKKKTSVGTKVRMCSLIYTQIQLLDYDFYCKNVCPDDEV